MTPREECEILLDALLSTAERLLRKNGEFYPIGATLTAEDEVSFSAASYDDDDYPESQRVMNDLILSHRELAAQQHIKASGIAFNAAVAAPDGAESAAILITLEHASGYAVMVGAPDAADDSGEITLGELFAQRSPQRVFSQE